jgi:hypothetical protein
MYVDLIASSNLTEIKKDRKTPEKNEVKARRPVRLYNAKAACRGGL